MKDLKFIKNIQIYEFDYKLGNSVCVPISIPYFDIVLDNNIFKRVAILDIRPGVSYYCILRNIFFDISKFQNLYFSKLFFDIKEDCLKEDKFDFHKNMELIILYDKDKQCDFIDKGDTLYDFYYFFKRFYTLEELRQYVNLNEEMIINYEKTKKRNLIINLDDKDYTLFSSLNLIYGLNGSGKTFFLKEISEQLKVPIFNLSDYTLELSKKINDEDNLRKYLYWLSESYNLPKYSSYEKYIHRLSQVLEYSREQNIPLLLDDLSWNSLDSRNKINLIDTLYKYSLENNPIIFTGCNEDIKSLVKKRVYKPNIIDL